MEQIGEYAWRVTGNEKGASLLIIGGMHGNEATGIRVVEQVRDSLREVRSGSVTLVIGNYKAMEAGERYIDGRDLNRYFTDRNILEGVEGTWEEKRAQELASYIREADVTIDLHSTNRPSTPFISSKIDGIHEHIYRWFPYEHVLEDPTYVLAGERATVDEYADALGKIGVCIETGQAADTSKVGSTVESLIGVLSELKIIGLEIPAPKPVYTPYTLTDAIIFTDSGFRFNPEIKAHTFERLPKGTIIGYQGVGAVVMPEDGVIIFPKLPKHMQLGKPVVYIARKTPVI